MLPHTPHLPRNRRGVSPRIPAQQPPPPAATPGPPCSAARPATHRDTGTPIPPVTLRKGDQQGRPGQARTESAGDATPALTERQWAGTEHGEALTDRLFGGSRSRTAGRLKADVCVEAARRLQAVSVTCIPDLRERADDAEVRHAWTGVHGLGWVTWQYFCALAGIDHFKPDVMLMRFAAETLGRYVSPAETDALLSRAFEELQPSYPELTKRALDHTIWLFERGP